MNVTKLELDSENLLGFLTNSLCSGIIFELVARSMGSGEVKMASVEVVEDHFLKVKFRNVVREFDEKRKLVPIEKFPEIYAAMISEAGRQFSHMEKGEAIFVYRTVDEMKRSPRGLLPYYIRVKQPA
jgi:hypothetical protein